MEIAGYDIQRYNDKENEF